MTDIGLRGVAWRAAHGGEPLAAVSALWRDKTGVLIAWDMRPPQERPLGSLEAVAADYDLLVIDHAHVGGAAREGNLVALDEPDRAVEIAALRERSVGRAFASYRWRERQWALPLEAVSLAEAWRPDRLAAPPKRWRDALALARRGEALLPLAPPHGLTALFTLVANLGRPCDACHARFIDDQVGRVAYDLLREFAAAVEPGCYAMGPQEALEAMAAADSAIVVAPLVEADLAFAREGFRPRRLAFSDIPAAGDEGPLGAALAGGGLAVSARRARAREAADFAFWVASAEIQAGPFVAAGGRSAHAAAWESPTIDPTSAEFFRATRRSIERAWVRPRHDGYLAFERAAGERLNAMLQAGTRAAEAIGEFNAMFLDSLSRR